LPALNKLVEEFKGSDVVFIAFGTDDANELSSILKKRPFNYNIVASANEMAKSYCIDIFGWPMSIIVDKGDIVIKITSSGFIDERGESHIDSELYPLIKKYLN